MENPTKLTATLGLVFCLFVCITLGVAHAQPSGACNTVLQCAQAAVQAAQSAENEARIAAPRGMIAAFDTECPTGWSRYANANERVLRGTSGAIGATGGRDQVPLSVANLPPHNHQTLVRNDSGTSSHDIYSHTTESAGLTSAGWVDSSTQDTLTGPGVGLSGDPVDIKPSFVAVRYCVRD
jgi:type V secretory pathway adhesin AidA